MIPACSLIVVTPVHEDAESGERLFRDLAARFGDTVFVVAVDDGSLSRPLPLSTLEGAGIKGVILKLRRNVGHQYAIAVGLGYVFGYICDDQRVVIMDADGEDRPSTIPELLKGLEPERIDVAVARRKSRVETPGFRLFYAIYRHVYRLMTGRAIGFGNFMALKAHAVRRLVAMHELPVHLASAVLASKLRTAHCPVDRGPRYAGQSKMNFVDLALHGFRGLMVFAEDVLVRVGVACTVIAALSAFGAAIAVALKLSGHSTPGWFSVTIGISLLLFLQTGMLALMTLILAGIMRARAGSMSPDYGSLIEKVLKTGKSPE